MRECVIVIDRFYVALCAALEQTYSLLLHVILNEWLSFYSISFSLLSVCKYVLTALFGCYTADATWNCCCLGASYAYTIQPGVASQCQFMQSHIRRMYVCSVVTRQLHFWQNDRDLLRANSVARGWNGYRNKSQHRKLTMEKKILPLLLRGLEPGTFRSRARSDTVTTELCPLPGTSEVGARGLCRKVEVAVLGARL